LPWALDIAQIRVPIAAVRLGLLMIGGATTAHGAVRSAASS
jgi:hypothetical protein